MGAAVTGSVSRGRSRHGFKGFSVVTVSAVALVAQLAGCASVPQPVSETPGPAAIPPRTVKFLFSNAEGHFFRGNIAEAIAGYSEVIGADQKNAPAFRGRATACALFGRESDALADYGRAVELDPRYDDAWLGRGLYLFSRGRYAEAIEDFDRVIALDPNNATAHKYRAIACDKVGRLREAAISRQAYIHCETPHEHPDSGQESALPRELKALGLER